MTFNNTDDTMWRHNMSIPLKFYAESKDKTVSVIPNFALPDGEAQGNLEIKVEKVGDVY